jgi:hypothetical protein
MNCSIFKILLPGILFLSSCDFVKEPYTKSKGSGTGPGNGYVKKVFLEDYTAQQCIYCPEAAIIAEQLRITYPGRVISMGVHVGSLATPGPAPYNYDFRTSTGNSFDAIFQLGTSLPIGMIDRMGYPTNTHPVDRSAWVNTVSSRLLDTCKVFLTINNTYTPGTRALTTNIKAKFLVPLSGTYRLAVLLTEDSIVRPQKDFDSINHPAGNSTGLVSNYVYHHVLRDAISGAGTGWSDAVTLPHSTTIPGDSAVFIYNSYSIPVNFPPTNGIPCRDSKCSVVAFIYDAVTLEVLQVEEQKVY